MEDNNLVIFGVKKQDTILLVAGLILGIGLGFALLFFRRAMADNTSLEVNNPGFLVSKGNFIGKPAPEFTLMDISGNEVMLSDYRGKVLLLNFWATWCAPCRLEMPELQERFVKLDREFVVVGINFAEPEEIVRSYVKELGLTFPVLLDPDGEIQELYRVRNYPTSFFIDEQGTVRIQHIGILSASQLDRYLRQMGVIE